MPLHDWSRLEANYFRDFHLAWIAALRHALNNGVLPPDYYALTEQTTPPIIPDVLTLGHTNGRSNGSPLPSPSVAVVTETPPRVRFATEAHKRKRALTPARRRVAIRHVSGHQLVAVIEILSHGNKSSKRDFRQFLNKAVDLLDEGVHLLLVDAHPPTLQDPRGVHAAVWKELVNGAFAPPADKPLTLASYAARGNGTFTAYVEPITVGDVLRDMPLFLDPERYVNVPLEPTYLSAWEGFPRQLRGLLEPPA
jgi:hypothetical protein